MKLVRGDDITEDHTNGDGASDEGYHDGQAEGKDNQRPRAWSICPSFSKSLHSVSPAETQQYTQRRQHGCMVSVV